MAVFELVYQRMEGPRRRPAAPALAIALSDLRMLRKRRLLKLATLSAGLLTFVLLFLVVARSGILNEYFPQIAKGLPPIDAGFFNSAFFLSRSAGPFHFLMMLAALLAGSGRIAEDLRSNALAIYLAKPLSREDYLLGKVLAVAVPVGFATLGIPLLTWITAGLVDPSFLAANLRAGAAILVAGIAGTAYYSAAALLFSSMVRSGRVAGLFFAGFVILSGTLQTILSAAFRDMDSAWLGFSGNFSTLGAHLLGTAPADAPPLAPAILAMTTVILGGFFAARRRVRAVEVIG